MQAHRFNVFGQTEDEIGQYLFDLFHESATPANGDVRRIG